MVDQTAAGSVADLARTLLREIDEAIAAERLPVYFANATRVALRAAVGEEQPKSNPSAPRFFSGAEVPQQRFWAHVVKGGPDECWQWTGPLDRRGYGAFKVNGRHISAHRASYAIANGAVPELLVCHSCDTPNCINPAHLWLGTYRDNALDRDQKQRDRYSRARAGMAKAA